MITIENSETYGWDAAFRGMRNPMNSWDLSDSSWIYSGHLPHERRFIIGEKDMTLAKKLVAAGPDHRKFLRFIIVTCDITAPMYFNAQLDTYKVATVRNSCSKMHKLLARPFEMSDFSFDKIPGYKKDIKQYRPEPDENEKWVTFGNDTPYYGYSVSDQGRIIHRSRMLSCSVRPDGYIFVTIHGKQIPVHRVVAAAFIPNTNNLPEIDHLDGNKQNNFVTNLEWVTRSENQKRAVVNNQQPYHLSTYTGKFSEETRAEIKKRYDEGESTRALANVYGVSHTCIRDIVNDKYKYVARTNMYKEEAIPMVDRLNELRDGWIRAETDDERNTIWNTIIQLLPQSYNQRYTWLANYEVLKSIYNSRRHHKLDEWHDFCSWIESLPYAEELIIS